MRKTGCPGSYSFTRLDLPALGLAGVCCVGLAMLTGCGTPGAPQPPSLKLPQQVRDLSAERNGDAITLHWTNPRKTTDRLPIKGPVTAKICHSEGSGPCIDSGEAAATPGAESTYNETLAGNLQSGAARPLQYFVTLNNVAGRSAGPSNPAPVVAGNSPGPVSGLAAEVRADGVALHWQRGESSAVRLHRTLLTRPAPKKAQGKRQDGAGNEKLNGSLMQPETEPVQRDLLVESVDKVPGALDKTARFGEKYVYTAQRVERVTIGGKTVELAGKISAPVQVDVVDVFPPAVPTGLEAVAVAEQRTIDLSWQPDTAADLAGYIVYRRKAGETGWVRISGSQPLISPAYRDATADLGVPYQYSVSAVDESGHESERSPQAEETVPNP